MRRRLALVLASALLAAACAADDTPLDAASPTVTGVRPDRPSTSTSASGSTTSASTTSVSAATTTSSAPVTTSTATPTVPTVPTAPTAPTVPTVQPVDLCVGPPPPLRAPAADRPRYRASVNLAADLSGASGDLDVVFTPDLDIDRLVFRLWPNGPRQAEGGSGLEAQVDALTVDDAARPVAAQRADATTLVVPVTARKGQRVTARLSWSLLLSAGTGDRVSYGPGWARMGSFLPLLSWEPGVGWATDPPTTGFAEASTFPAADFDLTVAAPAGVEVLATGRPLGAGRFDAVAVRDVGLSAGAFTVVRGVANAPDPVEVSVGVLAGLGDDPAVYARRVVAALEDFAARFGPYPWPTFTLAITPSLNGGIEYPGHVMQGPATDGRVTPHEVGHQWFYGLVGNNQGRDPVLDEGLASYAEFTFEGVADQALAWPQPAEAAGRAGDPMTYWDGVSSAYFSGVYVQGAQALLALGPIDRVDCALRYLVANRAHGVATEADLVVAAEAVFPEARATLASYGIKP